MVFGLVERLAKWCERLLGGEFSVQESPWNLLRTGVDESGVRDHTKQCWLLKELFRCDEELCRGTRNVFESFSYDVQEEDQC